MVDAVDKGRDGAGWGRRYGRWREGRGEEGASIERWIGVSLLVEGIGKVVVHDREMSRL